jgi:ferredoxin
VFTLTDDGYTEPRAPEVPAEFEEAVRTASRSCPEHAITVT